MVEYRSFVKDLRNIVIFSFLILVIDTKYLPKLFVWASGFQIHLPILTCLWTSATECSGLTAMIETFLVAVSPI